MVELLSIKEITDKYSNVYGFDTWEDVMEFILSNPVDKEIVDNLLDYLNDNDYFREPIWLYSLTENQETEHTITDGTHRLCAYIINGSKNAYVHYELDNADEDEENLHAYFDESNNDDDVDEENEVYLTTRLEVIGLEPDLLEEIWVTIRSIKVDEELWLTSSGAVQNTDKEKNVTTLNNLWDQDASPEVVQEAVIRQIKKYHPDIQALKITTGFY
jgi:hypothetical protein